MAKIKIIDTEVSIVSVADVDYISITDIAKQKNPIEPKDVAKNWMRLKNTLEYLGLREQLNNLAYWGVEIDPLMKETGINR